MHAPLRPQSDDELRAMVAEAIATNTPLAPIGHGTKSGIGHRVNHLALDMTGIAGVTLYEPDELILSVKAGTPVDHVVALLAEHGQELPFEPPVWQRPDGTASRGTIGGMVMTNFSGPRRLKVGAVRDHVLGFRGVSGRAEHFKAGGRVVKNVTGYDLARGLCGSWGTLAIATEVTFKILPRAETEVTLVLPDLPYASAIDLMCRAMQAPFDISSAAHLRTGIERAPVTLPGFDRTLLRLEGFEASVRARVEHLTRFLKPYADIERIDAEPSRLLWDWVGRIHGLGKASEALWRISVPPASAAAVTERVDAQFPISPDVTFAYDWSGGLIWLWVDSDLPDLGASFIRSTIAATGGGHATLMHGPADKRAAIDVFEPQPPSLAALNARLKAQFDPAGILNPGRMVRAG